MKKTLIAMLALSGVALGATADELNANLQSWKDYYDYKSGGNYVLSLTMDGANSGGSYHLIHIGDGWALYSQMGQYIGMDITSNGTGIESGWIEGAQDGTPYEGTLVNGETEGWMYNTGGAGNINGAMITFQTLTIGFGETEYTNSSIAVNKGGATWIYAATTQPLDLNDLSFGVGATVATIDFGMGEVDLTKAAPETSTVPEPTTATLSLLALVGLAARRRRR